MWLAILVLAAMQQGQCSNIIAYELIGCPKYVLGLSACEHYSWQLCGAVAKIAEALDVFL